MSSGLQLVSPDPQAQYEGPQAHSVCGCSASERAVAVALAMKAPLGKACGSKLGLWEEAVGGSLPTGRVPQGQRGAAHRASRFSACALSLGCGELCLPSHHH